MTQPLILLVDDDRDVRDSTRALLESAGYAVRDYASGHAFLDAQPGGDCVITDVRMPGMNGLELQRELRRRGWNQPVIVISAHGNIPMAVRAMREGAADFVEKPFDGEVLLESLNWALGRAPAAHSSPARSADAQAAEALLAKLTPRERNVFDQLIVGRSNKMAAFELGLSVRTVESHRANLLCKLEARSVADLVRISLATSFLSIKGM